MAKLYFHYSAMNAGKTTSLLQSSFNYRERGMRTLLFTAAIDDRHEVGQITSRIGLAAEAEVFGHGVNLYRQVEAEHAREAVSCVFIDEAQFLTREQVRQLGAVVDGLELPVICFGLRTDFRGELFEGSQALLALADELKEIKAICACGRKATMNLRVDSKGRAVREGESIEVGGNDRCVALCRRHFFERLHAGDGVGETR
ncbi:MAG: thymidine kinase [Planctomycetota bacterium]